MRFLKAMPLGANLGVSLMIVFVIYISCISVMKLKCYSPISAN
jgi:hypothetical protein